MIKRENALIFMPHPPTKDWTDYPDVVKDLNPFRRVRSSRRGWLLTIEDPKVFTRSWKMALPLQRGKEPGFELMEMSCHEGERSVELMLRSRSTEKTGKEKR